LLVRDLSRRISHEDFNHPKPLAMQLTKGGSAGLAFQHRKPSALGKAPLLLKTKTGAREPRAPAKEQS